MIIGFVKATFNKISNSTATKWRRVLNFLLSHISRRHCIFALHLSFFGRREASYAAWSCVQKFYYRPLHAATVFSPSVSQAT